MAHNIQVALLSLGIFLMAEAHAEVVQTTGSNLDAAEAAVRFEVSHIKNRLASLPLLCLTASDSRPSKSESDIASQLVARLGDIHPSLKLSSDCLLIGGLPVDPVTHRYGTLVIIESINCVDSVNCEVIIDIAPQGYGHTDIVTKAGKDWSVTKTFETYIN